MKKIMTLLALVIIVTVFVAGCSDKSKPKRAQDPVPAKICTMAGIGDTLDDWIKDYGKPNRDNDLIKNFKNDDLIVIVADDRILNITIQADDESKAKKYMENMIPTDGKFISQKTKKDKMIVEVDKEYTSESIKNAVKSNLTGHYSISESRDANTNKLIMFVIDCIPTLEEINKTKK